MSMDSLLVLCVLLLLDGATFAFFTTPLLLTGLKVVAEVFHFVPLFGWFGTMLWILAFLVTIVATLMGAGALLRTKFGQGPQGRWWPLFPARTSVPPAPQSVEPPPSAPPPPAASPGEPSPAA